MTGMYLGESFDCLPPAEIRRLQRVLRVILNHSNRETLRRSIRGALQRLGDPYQFVQELTTEARATFERLLGSFGMLSVGQLTDEERVSLEKNPFTVWPTAQLCTVSGEALQRMATHHRFRRQSYLFAYLHNLPTRERRAWARWLDVTDARNDRERLQGIYRGMARLQAEVGPDAQGRYEGRMLEEFFPDEPLQQPLSWFYRDVIGLYDALAETEAKLHRHEPAARQVLALLKAGRLTVRALPPEFGRRSQHQLVATLERAQPPVESEMGGTPVEAPAEEVFAATREQLLF